MLVWAFVTMWLPVAGLIVEMIRLGSARPDQRIFQALPGWTGCVLGLFLLLGSATVLCLLFAVAALHPR
jgi:hypothetical protein